MLKENNKTPNYTPFIIAFISAIGYATVYFFYLGYYNSFLIPPNFIEIDIPKFVIAIIITGATFSLAIPIVSLALLTTKKSLVAYIIFGIGFCIFILGGVGFGNILFIISTVLFISGLINKVFDLKKKIRSESKGKTKTFFTIFDFLPEDYHYIIVFTVLFLMISYIVGGYYAKLSTKNYYVKADKENVINIVFDTYKNKLICKEYDLKTSKFDYLKTKVIENTNLDFFQIDRANNSRKEH